jgi:hypothetical protein
MLARRIRNLCKLLTVSGCLSGCSATMPAVEMTFIDANDGSPIAGAHVLYRGTACRQNLFGCGEPATLWLTETVTDSKGGINLTAQNFWPYPFLFTGYNPPSMIVFKPGYALTVFSSGPIITKREDIEKWTYNNEVIKMRAATTDKESAHAIEWSAKLAEESYEWGKGNACMWKQIPGFLAATDRAVTNWKRYLESIPDQELRQQWRFITGPIQKLISREATYVKQGCGSPRLFFESYVAP